MNHRKFARRVARPIRDFLTGLALFSVIALSGIVDSRHQIGLVSSSAHARLFEVEPAAGADADRGRGLWIEVAPALSHPAAMLVSLALAFSTLTALNLWLARHICRVPPRISAAD